MRLNGFTFVPLLDPATQAAPATGTAGGGQPPTATGGGVQPTLLLGGGPPARPLKRKRSVTDIGGREQAPPRRANNFMMDPTPAPPHSLGVTLEQRLQLERQPGNPELKRKRPQADVGGREQPHARRPDNFQANPTIFPFAPPQAQVIGAGSLTLGVLHQGSADSEMAPSTAAAADSEMAPPASTSGVHPVEQAARPMMTFLPLLPAAPSLAPVSPALSNDSLGHIQPLPEALVQRSPVSALAHALRRTALDDRLTVDELGDKMATGLRLDLGTPSTGDEGV